MVLDKSICGAVLGQDMHETQDAGKIMQEKVLRKVCIFLLCDITCALTVGLLDVR